MIRLDQVTKRYPNGTVAVDTLDLDVAAGEVCVLLGPSGCGKTTTMKMINRLVEPTSGRIFLDGDDVTQVDPVALRRRIGYVIQHVGLFPHLTVAGNVATVPQLLGWDKRRAASRVDELLHLVGLDPGTFAHRYPDQLSGGQRQRVGVARALAADPPVLLMDEPFGAIDPIARDKLQLEFLRLQRDVRKTVVFVTHDVDEAVRLGDRIAVFRQGGVLEQHAPPSDVLGRPASAFVADFVGADRGLKRLAVTPVDLGRLEPVPSVAVDADLSDARRTMEAGDARWAVVLDSGGAVHGYLDREEAVGVGTAAAHAKPAAARVPATASLKEAFAAMLLHDAPWVAVVDGDRFLGVLTPGALHEAMRRSLDHGAGAEPRPT